MISIDQINELKQVDDILFEEFKEVGDFEAELFSLEYELDEEGRIIAKLHNLCRMTVVTIKHMHILIRRIDRSPDDKSIKILKKIVDKQLKELDSDLEKINQKMKLLFNDERAGQNMMKYCKKVETIVNKKLIILKEKFSKVK